MPSTAFLNTDENSLPKEQNSNDLQHNQQEKPSNVVLDFIKKLSPLKIFNFDKKELAQIYKEYDLLDTLFPVTRSCEGWQNITGHCGKCWWCEERMWGFGKL